MVKSINSFFAYPSWPPSIPETVKGAVNEINKTQECYIKTWQECAISGKFIIDVICREIDSADLFIADLTWANPNVLFELGYAIGKQKRVWLLLDPSFTESKNLFNQLRVLTTVGYAPYSNSRDIIKQFYEEQPWLDLQETIFAKSIEPALQEHEESHLLYLKNQHETEASRKLSRLINSFNLPTTLNDPKESSVQTLAWYVTKIWHAPGIIVHLSGESRRGSQLHNLRYAFVSGLAHGFQKPLLMLVETNYPTPIDYRDILSHYERPSECVEMAQSWLEKVSSEYAKNQKESGEYAKRIALSADLGSFNLGEYIAENEEKILNEYFIETEPFLRVIEEQHSVVVVGRKGTGKTANLFMAARKLGEDKRNLVCVIKPVSYDVQGVVRLGKAIKEKDKKGYLAETLWKFLIFSEIALAAYEEIKQLPYVDEKSPEGKLKEIMEAQGSILLDDFAVRLERCVDNLSSNTTEKSLHDFRVAISEILHDNILRSLRNQLGDILTKRKRVIILIDNLDKSWDRRDDLEHLSDFLFGLLSVAKNIPKEFAKHDYWRKPVNVSIAIFLRSDIFERVMKNAREPDKIPCDKLLWDDPVVLMRIVDERLAANREGLDQALLWGEVFCPTVKNKPTKKYILDMILPRPRDLVYFTKAALSTAVNRSHIRVEEDDILEAEKLYSQFVFEAVQVENGISLPELEIILFEFVGGSSILHKNEIFKIFSKSGIDKNRHDYALRHLIALSFLGVEIKLNEFRFCTSVDEIRKIERLSERYITTENKAQRYQIHKAFHAYLEVKTFVEGKEESGSRI
jgi:Cdc6-like AAA superfamily ATPase